MMLEEKLENKIRKTTKNKDYERSLEILKNCYKNQFKKMLKFNKVKGNKEIYLYDYIKSLKEVYKNSSYEIELEELEKMLYTENHTIKQQITWLLENCFVYNEYKLM